MTNIGRVDLAVLQLRLQLQRLARERAGTARATGHATLPPLERLKRGSSSQPIDDDDFRRTFVRALLTEELGEALANEAEFERISGEVWRILDGDPETRGMMDAALRRLR